MAYNNESDSERFKHVVDDAIGGERVTNGVQNGDAKLWEDELRVGDLIEPLGFDSIFAFEHHFTPYLQHPDPLQWLAFWAGRTSKIGVGTMLLILPWHHPIRLVEQLIQLQYMLGDRDMTIGMGRGLGLREYAGFDIPMSDSKGRFIESIKIIQLAIREESFEFVGDYYRLPDTQQRAGAMSIRPRPRDPARLLASLYGGWLSPTSYRQLAELGVSPMVVPNRDYPAYVAELAEFAEIRAQHGMGPVSACVTNGFCYCTETEDEAVEIRSIAARGSRAFDLNYEMAKNYHSGIPGYEFYKAFAERPTEEPLGEGFDQFVGTPDQLIAKIEKLHGMYDIVPANQFAFCFNRLSLPVEKTTKSMELFAKEVLPAIHELPVIGEE